MILSLNQELVILELLLMILITISTVYWLTLRWLERNITFFSTVTTCSCMHFSWPAEITAAGTASTLSETHIVCSPIVVNTSYNLQELLKL